MRVMVRNPFLHMAAPGRLMLRNVGWYLSMAVDTIARFRRQRSLTLARRILLPYAVVTLLMNSTFFMQVVVEQGIVRAEPHNPIVKVLAEPCSAGNVLSSILLPLLISMNDTLFVCDSSYPSI
jgi:hypothetical protein